MRIIGQKYGWVDNGPYQNNLSCTYFESTGIVINFEFYFIQLQVSSGQTVQGLKEILAMQIAIPVEEQKLVFKGKALAGMNEQEYQFGKNIDIIYEFLHIYRIS